MAGLSAEQWSEISPYLDQALDLDADARERFLNELAVAKPDVVKVLRDLIATHENNVAAEFLEQSLLDRGAEPVVGELIGAYTLESPLGTGGMGSVWLARRSDGRFDATVAIKILNQRGRGVQASEQIRHEASLLARLSHPNIAKVFDAGLRANGQAFLILEYVEGERIDHYCDKRQLSPIDRLRLYLQVLEAVAAAHSQQIVHRDIKPSNILVTSSGVVKLLDFGVALLQTPLTAADIGLASRSVPGMTPGYASPEQLRAEPVTPASDVYALGILLHVLIAGQHPYATATSTHTQIARAALDQDPGMASQSMESSASRWARGDLDAIIAKAINREASLRYATAADLAADIRLFLAHRPVMARPQSMANRMAMVVQRQWSGNRAAILILLVAVVLIVGVAAKYGQSWREKATEANPMAIGVAPPEKSVAVLPFVDMSEKKDQEYFSDGLSEELIDMLTKVPDLRVPARTSSFYFKGKQTTISDIAKMLSVSHVLEGSVRKSGNKLRVTAQLIRVDNGYHEWSQTYDRNAGDIFQIQDEISTAVVSALKVSLGAKAPANDGVTSSADAYDLYLLAQASYDRADSKEDYQKIVAHLREAIRRDPSFDRAWAMLSSTLSTMAGYTFNEPTQGFEDARSAALKAIELNPSGADGHRALAKILYVHDWNWEGADLEIRRALAVGPTDPKNLMAAGIVAAKLGRADEAVGYVTRAVAKDPLSSVDLDVLGQSLMEAGRLKESQAALRRVQALNPTYSDAHYFLGKVLLLDGKTSEALAEFEREVDPQERLPGLALVYHALGRSEDADAALRSMESVVSSGTPGAILIAETYAYRGEADQAFVWLTRSCERREPDCTSMKLDPLLKNLRTDPRFKAMLRKLKLPE